LGNLTLSILKNELELLKVYISDFQSPLKLTQNKNVRETVATCQFDFYVKNFQLKYSDYSPNKCDKSTSLTTPLKVTKELAH